MTNKFKFFSVVSIVVTIVISLLVTKLYSDELNNGGDVMIVFIIPIIIILVVLVVGMLVLASRYTNVRNSLLLTLLVILIPCTALLVTRYREISRNDGVLISTLQYTHHYDLRMLFKNNGSVKLHNEHMLGTDYKFSKYTVQGSNIILRKPVRINSYIIGDTIRVGPDYIYLQFHKSDGTLNFEDSIDVSWNVDVKNMVVQ
ncbi:hypothetical protein [Lewinella sp. 4G2]|uniref:hypothetical protein n=1 Tax=Lewinella sp. 4G2 TaxID=1803372 RepID=UPI0007E04A26|nr:hypothetical protein [Lewinella sp. 4G2]OAV45065.1 hypothetical protein A3850_011455 [Lewinella sp. 4G2]